MKKAILSYILITLSFCSIGQKSFNLTVNIDRTIDPKKLLVYCDNWEKPIYASDTFRNNSLSIEGRFYSKYVTVHVIYDVKSSNAYYRDFWISDKKATLYLRNTGDGNLFDYRKSVHTIDIQKENKKRSDSLKNYTLNELKAMNNLWKHKEQYNNRLTFDSLHRQHFISLLNKSSEYIRKHGNNYFYFWYFIEQYYKISTILFQKDTALCLTIKDSLLSIFSKDIISSFEGNQILQEMAVFLRPKTHILAPQFRVTDTEGNVIDLGRNKGKFVLLDFWASWCPPCMRTIPQLKGIRGRYSVEKLLIVGVNYDKDSTAFAKVVLTEQFSWPQIFDKENLIKKLYGETALPTWILINKEGIVVFNESGSDKIDKLENLLESFLTQ